MKSTLDTDGDDSQCWSNSDCEEKLNVDPLSDPYFYIDNNDVADNEGGLLTAQNRA